MVGTTACTAKCPLAVVYLKAGYCVKMQDILLSIYKVIGEFESASTTRGLQQAGMKGLDIGGKGTLLDAMKILRPYSKKV